MGTGLYERDFYAWAEENSRLLRTGAICEADLEHIAEEIEEMGRSVRRALKRRLEVLLAHLLKWEHQPEFRSKSWRFTVLEQRQAMADLLEESPSLMNALQEMIAPAYARAVRAAAEETELKTSAFPAVCPWSIQQVLDEDLWPQ